MAGSWRCSAWTGWLSQGPGIQTLELLLPQPEPLLPSLRPLCLGLPLFLVALQPQQRTRVQSLGSWELGLLTNDSLLPPLLGVVVRLQGANLREQMLLMVDFVFHN